MVAIVSGNNLGLSLSSLAVLGKGGVFGNANAGRNGELAYVNVANGNLVVQDIDARLAGRGPDGIALRTYNSQGLHDDDQGDNWAPGVYNQQILLEGDLNTTGSTLTRIDADGAASLYTWNAASGCYFSTDGGGAYDRIQSQGSNYVWTDGSSGLQQTYHFDTGRLLTCKDAQGNTLTYTYNADGYLASMKTANGEVLYYDYVAGTLTQLRSIDATGNTLSRVSYSYDKFGRLSRVTVDLTPNDTTDSQTFTTNYTYTTSDRLGTAQQASGSFDPGALASISQSDGTKLSFTYVNYVDPDTGARSMKVTSVTDSLGHTTSFSYGSGTTFVTDPIGLTTAYEHDAAGQLTKVTGPAVDGTAATTKFMYDPNGNVIRIVDAAGRVVGMLYDTNGNQTLQRNSDTVTRTFDGKNRLLTETRYPTPGVTTPALTVRYVYDAQDKGLLRFQVSAEGRVTEYRYDSFGNRAASIEYRAAFYPTGGLDPTQSPNEATMAIWVSSQDKTLTERTDIAYDARGQIIRTTRFASVDATGAGIPGSLDVVTQYVYDAAGRLLKSVGGTGADQGQTDYTYDGLGRLLTTTDALRRVTISTYDDANNRTTVALSNGLTTISSYDRAGRLISIQQTDHGALNLGTTQYSYDADDRLICT